MFNLVTSLLNGLFGVLKEISLPLLAFLQGKKAEKLKTIEKELKHAKEKEDINLQRG